MTRYVSELVAAGILEGNPITIGVVFWAALHGAVVLQLAGKLSPEFDFDTVREETFRALFSAYARKN
jgi:hypothetical protein